MQANSNMSMGSTVAGLFRDRESAEKAIQELQAAGFAKDQIDKFGDTGDTLEQTTKMLNELVSLGLAQEDVEHFRSNLEAGEILLTVHAGSKANEAISILERYGADTGAMHSNSTATTSEGVQRLELLKEVLRVNKQRVQTGEVTLRKEVVSETQTIEVPVTHEELVIERRPVTNAEAVTGEIGADQEIRVQLTEERVTVEKQPVVAEEVIIGKREVQQTEQVQETVRREELRTERQGDVIIDEAQDKPLRS